VLPAFTPRADFDSRYSDPQASATAWQDAREVLSTTELSWLTTVRPDGRPHSTPLITVWHDDAVHFCTGPEERCTIWPMSGSLNTAKNGDSMLRPKAFDTPAARESRTSSGSSQ
jgi:hypothetical protein